MAVTLCAWSTFAVTWKRGDELEHGVQGLTIGLGDARSLDRECILRWTQSAGFVRCEVASLTQATVLSSSHSYVVLVMQLDDGCSDACPETLLSNTGRYAKGAC